MLAHLVGDGSSIEFRTRLVRRLVFSDSLHVRLRFVVIEEPLHSGVVPTWRESMATIWARPTVAKPNATAARAPSAAKPRPQVIEGKPVSEFDAGHERRIKRGHRQTDKPDEGGSAEQSGSITNCGWLRCLGYHRMVRS
jgi:hypothetical protein